MRVNTVNINPKAVATFLINIIICDTPMTSRKAGPATVATHDEYLQLCIFRCKLRPTEFVYRVTKQHALPN